MPNANYRYGRRKEYEAQLWLNDHGCVAWRSAGSHGPFDITAVETEMCAVRFIQVKTTRGEAMATRWQTEWRRHPPLPVSNLYSQELWMFDRGTKVWDRSCMV